MSTDPSGLIILPITVCCIVVFLSILMLTVTCLSGHVNAKVELCCSREEQQHQTHHKNPSYPRLVNAAYNAVL